jgi:peptide/nickel transport system substrate-binding protein
VLAAALAFAAGTAHAAEDRAALMAQHRGGVLRLTATAAAGTIDPAIN